MKRRRSKSRGPKRFPVLKGKQWIGPRCTHCAGPLPEESAILAGGALRCLDPDRAVMFDESDAIGFLSLDWHDNKTAGAHLPIVDGAQSGQFEMHYCSTECLRAFLGACVDELEARVRRAQPGEPRRVSKRARKLVEDPRVPAKHAGWYTRQEQARKRRAGKR